MSLRSGKRKRSKTDNALDGVDAVGGLMELGPIGIGIAVFGGAIAVAAGVFRFMSRRS